MVTGGQRPRGGVSVRHSGEAPPHNIFKYVGVKIVTFGAFGVVF